MLRVRNSLSDVEIWNLEVKNSLCRRVFWIKKDKALFSNLTDDFTYSMRNLFRLRCGIDGPVALPILPFDSFQEKYVTTRLKCEKLVPISYPCSAFVFLKEQSSEEKSVKYSVFLFHFLLKVSSIDVCHLGFEMSTLDQ